MGSSHEMTSRQARLTIFLQDSTYHKVVTGTGTALGIFLECFPSHKWKYELIRKSILVNNRVPFANFFTGVVIKDLSLDL